MGFGGSVLAMIVTLKNNARPKRKAFKSWNKYEENIYQQNKPLQFKQVSADEYKRWRAIHQEEVRREKIKAVLITVLIILPISYLIISLFIGKAKDVNNSRIQEKPQLSEEVIRKKEEERRKQQQIINSYLNSGYQCLESGEYIKAKKIFYKAYKEGGKTYEFSLAYARAFVHDCLENQVDCQTTERMLIQLERDYGSKQEIIDLREWFADEIKK